MDIEKALLDPTQVFKTPEEVVNCAELSHEQKIEILERWKYDSRLLSVADEENMQSEKPTLLGQINRALIALKEGEK